mmetsp:Transcript_8510/g.33660  ORF Transcript_8510/g.33660 Transcript_8510/m.33660 type:complete len:226 (-) Transcript_8510:908-1585(-)
MLSTSRDAAIDAQRSNAAAPSWPSAAVPFLSRGNCSTSPLAASKLSGEGLPPIPSPVVGTSQPGPAGTSTTSGVCGCVCCRDQARATSPGMYLSPKRATAAAHPWQPRCARVQASGPRCASSAGGERPSPPPGASASGASAAAKMREAGGKSAPTAAREITWDELLDLARFAARCPPSAARRTDPDWNSSAKSAARALACARTTPGPRSAEVAADSAALGSRARA